MSESRKRSMSPRSEGPPGERHVRKRVCRACDLCRIKKSKCDGKAPCSRCNAEDRICRYGDRQKAQDRVYPKGYVEILEQQLNHLVAGMREFYRRAQSGQGWTDPPLELDEHGEPHIHDILDRLGVASSNEDNPSIIHSFEEDCDELKRKLVLQGAPLRNRLGSCSSDSEQDLSPISVATPSSVPSYEFLSPMTSAGYALPTILPANPTDAIKLSQAGNDPVALDGVLENSDILCAPTVTDPYACAEDLELDLNTGLGQMPVNVPGNDAQSLMSTLQVNRNWRMDTWDSDPTLFGAASYS